MASTVTAKTVETQLQTRLRIGTAETAISDANLFSVMNYTQRSLNYALKLNVSTSTLVNASATVITYTSATVGSSKNCEAVLSVFESSRSLMKIPNWNQLRQYDSSWYVSTAARSEVWSPIGRNMLAVYPASTGVYTVRYIQETTTIDSSADIFNIPNWSISLLYDVCELVWLSHLRLYPEAIDKVERLTRDLTAQSGGLV